MKNVLIVLIVQHIISKETTSYIKDYKAFVSNTYNIFKSRLYQSITEMTFIDNQCKDKIQTTYLKDPYSQDYFSKTITHSSKHANDLSTFNSCMKKKINPNINVNANAQNYQYNNYSFYLIELRTQNQNNPDVSQLGSSFILPFTHSYTVYGLCFIKDCKNTKDIRNLLSTINTQTNLFPEIKSKGDIKVIQINDTPSYSFIFSIILVVIIFIHVIGSSWRSVWCCFRKCFKNAKKYNDFTRCFRFSENAELLLNYKILSSKLNNNSGLTYIKGIKGIFIFFLVLGFVFQIILNSPIHFKEHQVYQNIMSSPSFCLIFIGLRIAPRVLLSCSGYILVFKLMCFLDNNRDSSIESIGDINQFNKSKTEDLIKEDNDNDKDNKDTSNATDLLTLFQEEINKTTVNDEDNKIPSFSVLIKFFIYQIHYYFICAIFILLSMYSMGLIKTILGILNPSWVYFKNTILLDSSFNKYWRSFLFYELFTIDFHTDDYNNEDDVAITNREHGNLFKFEWMAFNEMLFFILTSSLIFICYRKRYSLLKIVSVIICLLIGVKYGLFAFYNRNTTQLYSTAYYQMQDYGHFFTNPLYNYSFYLIGVLFGLMNYTVQKGLIFKEEIPIDHLHNLIPITIAKFFNLKSSVFIYITGFIGLLFVFALSSSQFIYIKNSSLPSFIVNVPMNYYYIIDIEIIVFIIHWITFGFFIKGDNILNYFLSQDFWEVENKLYFSFILLVNPVTLILLYQSETRISLELSDILFYTVISFIITLFLSALFYCLFESPYKRLFHFIYNYKKNNKIDEEEKDKQRLTDEEEDTNNNNDKNTEDSYHNIKEE